MNKILTAVLFIGILTFVIIIYNPKVHKTVSIADSKTDIAFEHKTVIINKPDKIQHKDTIKNKIKNKINSVENISNTKTSTIRQKDNITPVKENISLADNTQNKDKFSFEKNKLSPFVQKIKEREKHRIKELEEIAARQNKQPLTRQQYYEPPQITTTTDKKHEEPVKNQQTEMISWNIWRSNLGNQIAYDSEQWAEADGLYWFVFQVTKDRQIVKPSVFVLGGDSADLAAAYSYLKNSLNGSPILEFPKGTKRTKVSTTYMIYINENASDSYLDSSDFSDYENVR